MGVMKKVSPIHRLAFSNSRNNKLKKQAIGFEKFLIGFPKSVGNPGLLPFTTDGLFEIFGRRYCGIVSLLQTLSLNSTFFPRLS